MTNPPPQAGEQRARALIAEIDKLPDHYRQGADGGLYHVTHPDAVNIIAAAFAELERQLTDLKHDIERHIEIAAAEANARVEAERRAEQERALRCEHVPSLCTECAQERREAQAARGREG